MPIDQTELFSTNAGRLAFRRTDGDEDKATLVWFGGLKSDMLGGKATALHEAALAQGRPFVRFDYTGHGESDVAFDQTTVTDWLRDALVVLDNLTRGPLVLIGSSMGGWMSLLAARARAARVKGLALVAPAPDFTQRLMWAQFTPEIRAQIEESGVWMRPSPYEDGPYPITRALIESGRQHLLMDGPIDLGGMPVRILQGVEDDAVPWRYALELVEKITSPDVQYTLIKDGDHRLSRDADVAQLTDMVLSLAARVDQPDLSVSA